MKTQSNQRPRSRHCCTHPRRALRRPRRRPSGRCHHSRSWQADPAPLGRGRRTTRAYQAAAFTSIQKSFFVMLKQGNWRNVYKIDGGQPRLCAQVTRRCALQPRARLVLSRPTGRVPRYCPHCQAVSQVEAGEEAATHHGGVSGPESSINRAQGRGGQGDGQPSPGR